MHRLFGLPICNSNNNLGADKEQRLKSTFRNVVMQVIDERSVISSEDMAMINEHTKKVVHQGTHPNDDFGGIPIVLLVGDDYQLPPIMPGVASAFSVASTKSKQKKGNDIAVTNSSSYGKRQNGGELFKRVGKKYIKLQTSKRILKDHQNNLNELGKLSIKELMKIKGIGEAKAITIAAALEIGRRRQISDLRKRPRVTCSRDAYQVIAPMLADLYHEEFWVLMLNQANEVMDKSMVSSGGLTATIVDIRVFFRIALEGKAAGVIAVHNHPSGNLKPSQADITLTQKLVQGGKTIELPVLDHLIISEKGYYSFADEGVL